jgi:6-phosphogluconolactonase
MILWDHNVIVLTMGLVGLAGTIAVSAEEQGNLQAKSGKLSVYVGTYTQRGSKGIYLAHLDLAGGDLHLDGIAGEVVNPSFLTIHPSRRFLYAIGEVGEFAGGKGGAVSAFAVDPASGKLTLLNQKSSRGPGPCHVVLDKGGKHALVANYSGGSVACLPIGEDGLLGDATSFVQHNGSSVDPQRQDSPHAHSINLDAANRFAFAPDLGLDKVMIYRFDAAQSTLTPNDPPAAAVAPGSGPRHFAFHPNGRLAYAINELASTITAFEYDAGRGTLQTLQTVSTLPDGFEGKSFTADVHVHPSGKFVYGSNRGHDSIAAFAVDEATGKLTAIGHQSTEGKTPRNFGIDPTGAYLLAANQDTDNVVVFRIDAATGKLQPTGQSIRVPMPVCVKFMRP